jgi:hypothetical protein
LKPRVEQGDLQIQALPPEFRAGRITGFEAFADGFAGDRVAEFDPPFLAAEEF